VKGMSESAGMSYGDSRLNEGNESARKGSASSEGISKGSA
jgi:hypothetical protein